MRLFFINFLVFVALVLGLHGAAVLYIGFFDQQPDKIVATNVSQFISPDPVVGFHGTANFSDRIKKEVNGETIYDVSYTIDEFHRRVTPQTWNRPPQSSLVFLGDSNLFGEGVENNQTLPFFMGEKNPNDRIYNYAFQGWGPTNVMALLESGRLAIEVKEASGRVFYFFMARHADRLLGSTAFFRWANGEHPYYQWEQEAWSRRGDFKKGAPWKTALYKTIARSPLNHFFKINWPNSYSSANFQKVCSSFAFIRDRVKESLPNYQFTTVLWLHLHGQGERLEKCLRENSISYVNISERIPEEFRHHKWDRHLNSKGLQYFADKLQKALVARGLIGENLEPE